MATSTFQAGRDCEPIEVTVRPVEFDPNRPRVPILKPEISVQRIEIQREPPKKEEGEGDQRP